MVKQYKIDGVKNLVSKLEEKKNFILSDYSGTTVQDLSDLRKKLREKNSEFRVVKNNLFKRALGEIGYKGVDEYLKGPIAVTFADEEIGEAAKILKKFNKEHDNFKYFLGFLDNEIYNEEQIKKIADLPSRDVLISKIMYMVNGPTTGIAMGMKQVIASLARAVKAVAEENNK